MCTAAAPAPAAPLPPHLAPLQQGEQAPGSKADETKHSQLRALLYIRITTIPLACIQQCLMQLPSGQCLHSQQMTQRTRLLQGGDKPTTATAALQMLQCCSKALTVSGGDTAWG